MTTAVEMERRIEDFVWFRARGMPQWEAVLKAGWEMEKEAAAAHGARIEARGGVKGRIEAAKARVDEERKAALEGVEMPTPMFVLMGLKKAYNLGVETRNQGATLKSLELIGKALGVFVERSEIKVETAWGGRSAEEIQAAIDGMIRLRGVIDGQATEVVSLPVEAGPDHNLLANEGVEEVEVDPLA